MTKNVVFLGDKTLSLLTRDLNSQLKPAGSNWHAVVAGYDSWLVAPLNREGELYD